MTAGTRRNNRKYRTGKSVMADKIQKAYRASKNIYDDVITQGSFLSKMYIKIFWSICTRTLTFMLMVKWCISAVRSSKTVDIRNDRKCLKGGNRWLER